MRSPCAIMMTVVAACLHLRKILVGKLSAPSLFPSASILVRSGLYTISKSLEGIVVEVRGFAETDAAPHLVKQVFTWVMSREGGFSHSDKCLSHVFSTASSAVGDGRFIKGSKLAP